MYILYEQMEMRANKHVQIEKEKFYIFAHFQIKIKIQ